MVCQRSFSSVEQCFIHVREPAKGDRYFLPGLFTDFEPPFPLDEG